MSAYTFTASLGDSSSLWEYFLVTVPPLFWIPQRIFDSGNTSWISITGDIGTVLCERFYFTPFDNVPAAVPSPEPGVTTMVVSIKPNVAEVLTGALDSELIALFEQVRPGDMWTCWHEGETKVDTPTDLVAVLTHCYELFKEYAPHSATFGQICASYTASGFSSHGPLGQWVCCPFNGGAELDWFGIDAYPVNANYTFMETIGPVVTEVEAIMGYTPAWALTECNVVASVGVAYTDAQQLQYFQDAWAWAIDNTALTFIPYFGNEPDVWPPYPDVV